jgi:undecaprenyl-diphosphatase
MTSEPVSRLIGLSYIASIPALLLPAVGLSLAAAGTEVLPGDVAITLFIQERSPAVFDGLVHAVNWIGSTVQAIVLTVTITLVLYLRGMTLPALLIFATLPMRGVNFLLKRLLESPRPEDTLVRVTEYASGFGFPSGHTNGATLLYGALFLLAPFITNRPALCWTIRIGSLAMIVMAGISRIHAGAHWPSDVLGAWLWATVILLLGALIVHRWGLLAGVKRL